MFAAVRALRRPLALVALTILVSASCTSEPSASACGGSTVKLRQQGILSIGTDLGFPPFAFTDVDSSEPTGYEVELVRLVASMVGLPLEIQHRNASALLPGVVGQRHDLAASALRDTPELRASTCVSRRFGAADLAILARLDDPRGPRGRDELPGRVLGVVQGSFADSWTQEHLGETESVPRYATHEDLLDDLRTGAIDAALGEHAVALWAERADEALEVVSVIDVDHGYVFAGAPDNAALMELVDAALVDLEADGRLADLQRQWFGTEL